MVQINQEVRQFVIDNFLFGNGDGLKNDDSFLETGIVDSTGVLELIAFLEGRFGIVLQERDLTPDNLDSVDRLAKLVESRVVYPEKAV